jgi:predicted RNase H-like HicB family nuclease
MTKTYIAVYERDAVDDAWNVRVDAIPGCRAQARSLPSAQASIRAALGWRVGADEPSVIIEDRLPPTIAAVAKRANRARREADRAAARAQQELFSAARELAELGLSRRDSAALLCLSHQRVQQLLTSK